MRTQVSRRRACRASDLVTEGLALDHSAVRHLENFATPENDSFMEEFAAIVRDFNVPRSRVRRALTHYRAFRDVHREEIANYRQLNGALVGLDTSVAGDASGSGTLQAFTVRGVVDALGGPLRTLADARRGLAVDNGEIDAAWATVLDAARVAPRDLLESPWVRSRLRGRRSAELDRAIEAAA